jgi:hypothetical protein
VRYVDIDLLERPAGWQETADKALDELRAEINAADTQAQAAGQDVAAARKNAITAGLNKPARQAIWGALAPSLAKLRKNKCWYSESKNPSSDKNVDHFRPKNRVAEDPDHEGYWWKAFDWSNYRYVSQWCNQRRVDKVNGTSGGKWDHFPLQNDSFRARLETDDINQENLMLLDPIDPDDWKFLTFRPDGHPTPAKPKGTLEYERAAISIETYHLHCRELVDDRRLYAGMVQRAIEEMEILYPKIADPHMRLLYKQQHKNLLRMIHPDSEYSSAALSYARTEIFKIELGHQVKRDWLEDILSAKL